MVPCDYCSYQARDIYNLKRHHKIKHVGCRFKEKPKMRDCEICDFSTKYMRDLKRHHKRVHNGKPMRINNREMHMCTLCDEAYINWINLQNHYNLAHGWTYEGKDVKSTQTDTRCGCYNRKEDKGTQTSLDSENILYQVESADQNKGSEGTYNTHHLTQHRSLLSVMGQARRLESLGGMTTRM